TGTCSSRRRSHRPAKQYSRRREDRKGRAAEGANRITMGREIVYCEGCGNSLREADFERGRARMIDNRPFCTQCRPVEEPEPAPRRPPSGKVAAQPRKSATGGIPIVPPPRRVSAPASNPLPILAGVGGVIFLVLIFAVTQSGPKRPPTPE